MHALNLAYAGAVLLSELMRHALLGEEELERLAAIVYSARRLTVTAAEDFVVIEAVDDYTREGMECIADVLVIYRGRRVIIAAGVLDGEEVCRKVGKVH